MHTGLSAVRTQFPLMPDDVFDQWLKAIVLERGWPFHEGNESTIGTVWEKFFLGRPISYWQALRWELHELTYEEAQFDQVSLNKSAAIVQSAHTGQSAFATEIERSAERLESCASYIHSHGRVPRAVVCELTPNHTLYLLDGHHRLAALIGAVHPMDLDEHPVSVWLGRPAASAGAP